jgi:hypothetical protein
MFLRFFSFGILAAIASLLAELILFSFFPVYSITLLVFIIPFLEESVKYAFLFKSYPFLPKRFSLTFLVATMAFGLGFALPENILSKSNVLITTDTINTLMATGIHLLSALILGSALLLFKRHRSFGTILLLITSFLVHALYNFSVFMQ